MRILIILTLLFVTIFTHAQSVGRENNRFLTYEQNINWLSATEPLNKSERWDAIKLRFLTVENQNVAGDSIQYSPLIVINGIPFFSSGQLTEKEINQVNGILNNDSIIEIFILDKAKGEWIFCKPFSGVIILRVNKKTGKKLSKLKSR